MEYDCKVLKTQAFKDKIYNKLKENRVQDRILNGNLRQDKCDSEDVYGFLHLLQH